MITIQKKGTKASDLIHILDKIPLKKRNMVAKVTNNMRGIRDLIAMKCFRNTEIVTHRFHVQKLISEAVRKKHIRLRRKVIELNNSAIKKLEKMENLTNNSSLEANFYYTKPSGQKVK